MGFVWRQKSNRGLSESVEVPASSHVWHTVPAFLPAGHSGRTVGGVSVMMLVGGLYRSCRQKHRQLDSCGALADARVTYRGSQSAYSASRWGRGEGRRRMWCLSLTAFLLWLCHLSQLMCFSLCLSTFYLSLYFRFSKGAVRIMTKNELVSN